MKIEYVFRVQASSQELDIIRSFHHILPGILIQGGGGKFHGEGNKRNCITPRLLIKTSHDNAHTSLSFELFT